ncbi:probable E3 ubiquitin-protein ligase makorin-1 [Drosophila simulans]|uniref:probable E3 ubiquitin-protein ligase makorin-1 n=1 Tax=Drosophila simulans TaxID=7240 RepID=UPI00078AEB6D|nr:probable E3 ubiquitin-protein ligase makorin-1 [Drosophila simulans]KMZ09745.1 uncharacterized protein Dsimw501_GD27884 [Drosophila simulans]
MSSSRRSQVLGRLLANRRRYSLDETPNENQRPQISEFAAEDVENEQVVATTSSYSRQMTGENVSKNMKIYRSIERSKDKTCGICLETVVMKKGSECRFGILSKCRHIFCLPCIRTWRQEQEFESNVKRGCPECRVFSGFVCPSEYWVDTKEDKDKLLIEYRAAMGAKDCRHFNRGFGDCPFGTSCFYKHRRMPDDYYRRHPRVDDDFYIYRF